MAVRMRGGGYLEMQLVDLDHLQGLGLLAVRDGLLHLAPAREVLQLALDCERGGGVKGAVGK